jgi:hypothetical protein
LIRNPVPFFWIPAGVYPHENGGGNDKIALALVLRKLYCIFINIMYLNNEKYWQKGQTIIETALLIILLLMLFFGIAEISRAWWLKNALNNGAIVGVRVAIVESINTPATDTKTASFPTDCTNLSGNAKVFCVIWNASGIPIGSTAKLEISEDVLPQGLSQGDSIKVTVTGEFNPVVPNLLAGRPSLLPIDPVTRNIKLTSTSIMRYE